MADQKQDKKLSKIIAYMLGVAPEEFGLMPDEDGFVKIKELLQALHEEEGWRHVRQATLHELTMTLPEVSFEIRDNRIRSRERSESAYPVVSQTTPRQLFTCVRQRAYPHVLQKGIFPTSHDRILLSSDRELAEKIGARRDPEAITLTVHTEEAENENVVFYRSGEKMYLADYIPVGCFTGPALPRDKEKKPPGKGLKKEPAGLPAEGRHNQAGTFFIHPLQTADKADNRNGEKRKKMQWKRERKRMNRQGRKQWPDA